MSYREAINEQMKKGAIKNPHQLSQLAGIHSRTAYKAVNTDKYCSPRTIAKIAVVFGFGGWIDFREYAMKTKGWTDNDLTNIKG